MTVKKAGWITITVPVLLTGDTDKVLKNQSIQKKPSPAHMKEISFTLNWSMHPSDLDAHMVYFPLHQSSKAKATDMAAHLSSVKHTERFGWMNRGSANTAPYLTLDVDVMTGKGPETVTMHKLKDGYYRFYVKCYSCWPGAGGDKEFAVHSHATVTVVSGGKQIKLSRGNGKKTSQFRITRDSRGPRGRIWDIGQYRCLNGKCDWKFGGRFMQHEPSKPL